MVNVRMNMIPFIIASTVMLLLKNPPRYARGLNSFDSFFFDYSIRIYPAFGCQVNIFDSPKNLSLDITNS
ncbi:MAG: hypothetical protein Ct9H300mP18_10330 [Candidatus Neomarinimicrobiota bacterium]|nr:MAG: hypothetical protein Ct9H300mP18_10330 [Candidatus Neomarinimicrobiota bacterium]